MGTTSQLMTAEELIQLDDGLRHELVKGELLTMSPASEEHGAVAMNLSLLLGQHVKTNRLGRLYAAETGFKLETDPDTVLAPDIAFIRRERMGVASTSFRQGAPDLVVEVVSPGERRRKVEEKALLWLSLGTQVVWIVKPRTQTVEVYRVGEHLVLAASDLLGADDVIPGFQIAVSDIFEY